MLVAFATALPGQEATWHLRIEGRDIPPHIVSLAGTPASPAPGDLLRLHDVALRLDRLVDHNLASARLIGGRLACSGPDRHEFVAVDATRLLELAPAARARLRGVVVDRWSERIAAALDDLPADVPLVVLAAPDRALPSLPPRTRHLWLRWNTARGPDLGPARTLVALRSLYLDGGGSVPIDLATFVEAIGLRHLTVRGCVVDHGDRIGAFGELRAFESRDAAVDLAWLAPATTLVSVRIAGANVRSLDDLAALPRLADVVVADAPMLAALPATGFPALRRLRLERTAVDARAVASFRSTRPSCDVDGHIDTDGLQAVLATANRVVVTRRGGVPGPGLAPERETLLDDDAPSTVRAAAALFAPRTRARPCATGPPGLEFVFWRQEHRVATLAVEVDAGRLRWEDGPWSEDASLGDSDTARIAAWLDAAVAAAKARSVEAR